jgi:3-oxoacyl-[acyl-carrier-protein] synthase-1
MPRVFITGVGFVTSIGNDAATVTGNLREMRHGFELYPPFQKPEIACKVIGTIKGFMTDSVDPEDWTWPAGYEIKRETIRSMRSPTRSSRRATSPTGTRGSLRPRAAPRC